MSPVIPLFKREFLGYFRSPVAYVFLVAYLVLSVIAAFFLGGLFKSNLASLDRYFVYLPWLFIMLVPAAGMRLWAEEKRTGTVELLFTLPVTTLQAVVAKFLASWAFLCAAILMSFPMVLTVGYLGSPDYGVIASGYLGTVLMAGAFLGVTSLTSALTKNQVISFVISMAVCLVLVLLGWSVFNGMMSAVFPQWLVDLLANFSFTTHFEPFVKGIIDPKDLVYFLSVTAFSLFLNVVVLER